MTPDGARLSSVSVVIPTHNRRDEVIECIDSVLGSTLVPDELIVVDNASSDGTCDALRERYAARIMLIASEENLYAGGGRNLGARHATGDYLLFIDSDNVIDKAMVEELLAGVEKHHDAGIGLCGPFMYYYSHPRHLTWVTGDINMWTSQTWWRGVRELDEGQYAQQPFVEVGHIPNVFMLPRALFQQVGGIDPDYVMHYEESDLAERVKRAGYRVALFPQAKTLHKIPFERVGFDKQFSGRDRQFLYYAVRNRIFFIRKNASLLQKLSFLFLFQFLFLGYSLLALLRGQQSSLLGDCLRAHCAGLVMRASRVRSAV